MSLFNASEWQRYQRHVQLKNFGATGQTALKQAHILIVGAGGLGCPAAQYLGAAGVGHITIVDADTIAASNLQRQILFTEADIGLTKVAIVKQRLLANNPHITVTAQHEHLTAHNAHALIQAADLVLDCTDSFDTRYLINDTCLQTRTAWIYASVIQFSGQVALLKPDGACFRCVFPHKPSTIQDCNSAGVLGVMPGLLATIQVNEAIKYLSGLATPLANTLMLVEGLSADFTKINLSKDTDCRCNDIDHDKNHSMQTIEPVHTDSSLCPSPTTTPHAISATQFETRRQEHDTIVIDVRSEAEHLAFNIGGENHATVDHIQDVFSDKEHTYLLYCQTGIRSEKAAKSLQNSGFKAVYSLTGGLSSWLSHYA